MRVLLMISNSNMSAREIYGMVLRERHPGWGISNMSGLPISPATILKGFDVVVYELGAADDPRRYKAVLALWEEVKELGSLRMITPTTFRRGDKFTPNPALAPILGGLRRAWRSHAPTTATPIVLDLAADPVWLTDIAVSSRVLRINNRVVSAFTGRLRFA